MQIFSNFNEIEEKEILSLAAAYFIAETCNLKKKPKKKKYIPCSQDVHHERKTK